MNHSKTYRHKSGYERSMPGGSYTPDQHGEIPREFKSRGILDCFDKNHLAMTDSDDLEPRTPVIPDSIYRESSALDSPMLGRSFTPDQHGEGTLVIPECCYRESEAVREILSRTSIRFLGSPTPSEHQDRCRTHKLGGRYSPDQRWSPSLGKLQISFLEVWCITLVNKWIHICLN